jgi:AcrR family transcriptional regulator
MRASAETKAETRRTILTVARRLFAEHGFDATTTRHIAVAAGIANGTLFNYFPTKEAIILCLASEASAEAIAESRGRADAATTLEEAMFVIVAAALRKLKPLRTYLTALLETALSPIAVAPQDEVAALRTEHLEAISALIAKHLSASAISPVALQLYWALYVGSLAFWAGDESPKQEDTFALIDDSLNMYVAWLRQTSRAERPQSHL